MLNRTVLVGRLTKDIEVQKTSNGNSVCTFTLAVDKPYKKQDGSKDTNFVQIQAWRNGAEYLSNYAHQGSMIGVDGRIDTYFYDDSVGTRHYVTQVVAEQVRIYDFKTSNRTENNLDGEIVIQQQNVTGNGLNEQNEELPF